MKARLLVLVSLGVSVITVFLSVLLSAPHEADGYDPPGPGLQYPVFASPNALAASSVTGLSDGAVAWVTYQGEWRWRAACPAVCDGANTCRTAPSGCWVRDTVRGVPGAQNVANWYVKCDGTGNDSNSCTSAGSACATILEVQLRVGRGQCFPPNMIPVLNVDTSCATTFANNIITWDACSQGSEFPGSVGYMVVTAPRIYTGADGGALGNFTVSSYTAWDGGAKQEGVMYAVAATDGGATYDPATMGPAQGYGLEDTTTGAAIWCGDKIDAGTCNVAGGYAINSFANTPPVAGHALRLFKLVQLGTNASTSSITFNGWGGPDLQNFQLGSGTHTIQIQTAPSSGNLSLVLESCLVNGVEAGPGSEVFSLGNAYGPGHVHTYGQFETFVGDMLFGANVIEARMGGMINNIDNLLLAGGSLVEVGCTVGTGFMENDGNLVFTQYSGYGIKICQGSNVWNTGSMWGKNAVTGFAYWLLAGGQLQYNSGHAPGLTGSVTSAPWSIGGAQYDAGAAPPLTNSTNYTGVVVNQ